MNIAIIGYGIEGKAAYDYWHEGNDITVCDQNAHIALPEGVFSQLGDNYLADLGRFDLIVRSPFVRPDLLVSAASPAILEKVTSCTNEFFNVCPTKNIIGVTGTKGKGTTSTLIAKLLEADGKRVHLGGNIGVAALDLLKESISVDDWIVLELSSFQLIDLKYSPHIGVCLMIVPEHLNWHIDTDEYYTSKAHLFTHQGSDDFAIYNDNNDNSKRIASTSKAWKVPYMSFPGAFVKDGTIIVDNQPICETSELKLLGAHNWQNVCAALTAVWKVSQNVEAFRSVVTSFTGLENRLELVRELDGVSYYDDSFGTTPETAIVAAQAFNQPKVLILGGSDKGAHYDDLAQVIAAASMRRVLLIGEQAARIQTALEAAGFTNFEPGGASMPDIIATAKRVAESGDAVILSPACASYDMFKDYKDRGVQFKQAVAAL